jgi:DNA ligase-4
VLLYETESPVLFRKLHSSEAKWLIRILLKTYGPARVPEALAMWRFHFLLPDILGFQKAVQLLQSPTIGRMPARVANGVHAAQRAWMILA